MCLNGIYREIKVMCFVSMWGTEVCDLVEVFIRLLILRGPGRLVGNMKFVVKGIKLGWVTHLANLAIIIRKRHRMRVISFHVLSSEKKKVGSGFGFVK